MDMLTTFLIVSKKYITIVAVLSAGSQKKTIENAARNKPNKIELGDNWSHLMNWVN